MLGMSLNTRDRNILIIFVVFPLVLSLVLLVLVFRPSSEDSAIIQELNNNQIAETRVVTQSEYLKDLKVVQDIKTSQNTQQYDSPVTDLKYNSDISAQEQAMNNKLYQVTAAYYNAQSDPDIPPNYIDPIFLMAISNVELGGVNDPNLMFAPAIPTNYVQSINPNMIQSFGIGDTLNYASYWTQQSYDSLGPFQMSGTYGVPYAVKPGALKSNESTRVVAAWGQRLLPIYVVNKGITNGTANTGDRFNWVDCCNRVSGTIDFYYKTLLNNNAASKSGDEAIDNRYAFMALEAEAHNSGWAVVYNGDTTAVTGSNAWPWGPAINCREYAHELGAQGVISYLTTQAKAKLQSAKPNVPDLTIGNDTALEYLKYLESQNLINPSVLPTIAGTYNTLHAEYPIKVLYCYIMLSLLYSGN
jgi:hypothetical protein